MDNTISTASLQHDGTPASGKTQLSHARPRFIDARNIEIDARNIELVPNGNGHDTARLTGAGRRWCSG